MNRILEVVLRSLTGLVEVGIGSGSERGNEHSGFRKRRCGVFLYQLTGCEYRIVFIVLNVRTVA